METHWIIEEWVPSEHAIGGKGYWTQLNDGRFDGEFDARHALGTIRAASSNRTVRLIEETRKVVNGGQVSGVAQR